MWCRSQGSKPEKTRRVGVEKQEQKRKKRLVDALFKNNLLQTGGP